MSGLHYALRGDDAFFAAIEASDQSTFGITCKVCDTYHVGQLEDGYMHNRCPECGCGRGSFESPALGSGPRTLQQTWDDGGGAVIAGLIYGSRP
jgi:hypothetical protein